MDKIEKPKLNGCLDVVNNLLLNNLSSLSLISDVLNPIILNQELDETTKEIFKINDDNKFKKNLLKTILEIVENTSGIKKNITIYIPLDKTFIELYKNKNIKHFTNTISKIFLPITKDGFVSDDLKEALEQVYDSCCILKLNIKRNSKFIKSENNNEDEFILPPIYKWKDFKLINSKDELINSEDKITLIDEVRIAQEQASFDILSFNLVLKN